MNANEFKRWLAKQGCKFENHRGGSGHLTIYRDGKKSQLPMHGGNKELGPGLISNIKKQLGIK
ncbi:type II toxin-antitoxin system HicA family toxin [Rhizobium sp. S152]|uniref:type II toxin-antitoxin system HicA family toxin n=1 Tax=Rhizobium sp. S152 TaxID=3055038 RepID=UPI0025A99CC0|nr:type II toxin-antitoxin system HicA family toxin [Rhizobium sp. S152]MDM9628712.1 type II toxin-antitoxin system HicA family toxin [Rhizobium sp. S152]